MSQRLEKRLRKITNRTLTEEATKFIEAIYMNRPKYIPKKYWLKIVDYVMSRYRLQ